ncbi:MAG TPA: iron-containing alcohol dehydrogenase [Streptosporangiaceae bacterium]|nr:iron-containing alcohol dehydrogenase [Streptosporangiaceae bacterium]
MTDAAPDWADLDALRGELAGGGLRPLGLGRVVAGGGALDALPGLVEELGGPGDVVVLAAATPITAAGRDLRAAAEAALGRARWVVVGPDDGAVHADAATLATAAEAAEGAGCVVTIGSGTITDIGKAIDFERPGSRLISLQTATSVNGYADPFSVLLRKGVKRTTASRWPDALLVDTDVLAGAPPELNRAGAGDMMAMFTALADWYLASAVAGREPLGELPGAAAGRSADPRDAAGRTADPRDAAGRTADPRDAAGRTGDPPFHPAVARLVRARGPRLLALAGGLGGGRADAENATAGRATPDRSALAELAGLLTLSGISMGVAGSTAPASGMEHAVSHLLEMTATARGERGNYHGTQVGVAAVVAARTWARVLERIDDGVLDRPAALPDPDAARRRIDRAFAGVDPSGAMAGECFADYARKLTRLAAGGDPLAVLRASWPRHRAMLDDLLSDPGTLTGALASAGLPARFADLAEPVDEATARWAVANCPLQRQRFGVADLAMLIGAWEDDDIDAVLDGMT